MAYQITNTHGATHFPYSTHFNSIEHAVSALQAHLEWDELHTYRYDDETENGVRRCWACYPTEAAMAADSDAAYTYTIAEVV